MFNPNPKLVLTNQFGEESVNYVSPGSEIPASFKSTPVVLTAAQVIALNATPIEIIPAIAGKIIQVAAVIFQYKKGSAAFTIGANKKMIAQYATGNQAIASIPETGFLDSATDKEGVGLGVSAGGLSIRGDAVELTTDDATPISVGTGSTVTVFAYYNIIG